jgi:hypothetical protein
MAAPPRYRDGEEKGGDARDSELGFQLYSSEWHQIDRRTGLWPLFSNS